MMSDKNSTRNNNRFTDRIGSGTCPELDVPILSCQETRNLDSDVVMQLDMPSLLLMENAGRSLVDALKTHLLQTMDQSSSLAQTAIEKTNPFLGKRFLILCGKGNNGGDGFVIARRLLLFGAFVHVVTTIPGEEYTDDAYVNFAILECLTDVVSLCPITSVLSNNPAPLGKLVLPAAKRLTIDTYTSDRFDELISNQSSENDYDWIIDALLGTGATGALRSPYDRLIQWINKSGKPVFSVDLPSGLNADTGRPVSDAVHATLTCTLAACKPGLLLPEAAPYVGKLVCGDIGVPLYN
ncbi:MAG: NAD(P)H-hydrate epimerase [Planctomycetia bacterium]|nr:NAD(P)H-hydrate epimerase [Planctomycetia bacterium]